VGGLAISGMVFACLFAGGLIGIWLRAALPEHHLSADSKAVIQMGMGLIATMSALVLGLLIASAQTTFSAQRSEFAQLSSNIIVLDRVLAHYGPEANAARAALRDAVQRVLQRMDPEDGSPPELMNPKTAQAEGLYEHLQGLTPQTEAQRTLKTQALALSLELTRARWLMFEREAQSVPFPFLVVLVCWLAMIFGSFGLYARPNATVVAVLFVCALSVAGAIFLILEMDQPYAGWIRISPAPLRLALSQLGQ